MLNILGGVAGVEAEREGTCLFFWGRAGGIRRHGVGSFVCCVAIQGMMFKASG